MRSYLFFSLSLYWHCMFSFRVSNIDLYPLFYFLIVNYDSEFDSLSVVNNCFIIDSFIVFKYFIDNNYYMYGKEFPRECISYVIDTRNRQQSRKYYYQILSGKMTLFRKFDLPSFYFCFYSIFFKYFSTPFILTGLSDIYVMSFLPITS